VSGVHGEFRERSAHERVRSLPRAHLSLELGHLYQEDLAGGPERLRTLFAEVAPWARAARDSAGRFSDRPRVSTCFLIDDYFATLVSPQVLVPQILDAAAACGLRIDYLARESACAQPGIGGVAPVELLVARLVDEPFPGTDGSRPPTGETGWLSNGRRSPSTAGASAMEVPSWAPPAESAARGHSVFVDVQLWDDTPDGRVWSCAVLAATWQLLRLGLLRHRGEPVWVPAGRPAAWPAEWSELPPVVRLEEEPGRKPAPFAAYLAHSVLPRRFLPVELAVRTVLSQVWHDPEVTAELAGRARQERLRLAEDVLDRIGYAFPFSGPEAAER
jgi:hypothetical protein